MSTVIASHLNTAGLWQLANFENRCRPPRMTYEPSRIYRLLFSYFIGIKINSRISFSAFKLVATVQPSPPTVTVHAIISGNRSIPYHRFFQHRSSVPEFGTSSYLNPPLLSPALTPLAVAI